ncbi:hypothetical protein [Streptomyces sp. HUAS TT7]|uniref:hypothetical protein n=1 Tax=Streptomyces sp. HUAS TT7 TaxID=3447507 RepID=UPI003F656490
MNDIAQIAALAVQLWDGPTHLTFVPGTGILSPLRAHGLRRAGTGYVPVASHRAPASDGVRAQLAHRLEDLLATASGCEALASEPGGWYRLALYPVPGQPDAAAYPASDVVLDQGMRLASLGEAVVTEYLRLATPAPGDNTPPLSGEDRAHRGLHLVNHHERSGGGDGTMPEEEERARIADTIANVLHHADGWHQPRTVILEAFGLHWGDDLPDGWADAYPAEYRPFVRRAPYVPPQGLTTRDLNALAGAIADLFAAAALYGQCAEDAADAAEACFWVEAEEVRFRAIRDARDTAAGRHPVPTGR